jgi:signal transduction histidine kinase
MINKLSIKNRIALYSVLGIASLSILVFIAIYVTVKNTVYSEIDSALKFEAKKHSNEVMFTKDSVYFAYKDEWLEREHMEIEVYPLFVELFDRQGTSLDKSPNLLNKSLRVDTEHKDTFIQNLSIENKNVRQIQAPLNHQNKTKGYVAIAVPLRDAELVIQTLLDTLLLIYPILLVITFFTSRLISRITIRPITRIAKTVSEINTNNLNQRVPEARNGDELEVLTKSINDFLNRIDASVKREKQFTADASHQLRTPLAILKGNLEVLIRKQRKPNEYIEDIKSNIYKIDEMSDAVDKLLVLAQLNSNTTEHFETEELNIYDEIERILNHYKKDILGKQLTLGFTIPNPLLVKSDKTYLGLILDNLVSNAIKYAEQNTKVTFSADSSATYVNLSICNKGPKIPENELQLIFNPFFRNQEQESSEKGYGLGLAIVAKAIDLLNMKLKVTSEEYTCFSLNIPKKLET